MSCNKFRLAARDPTEGVGRNVLLTWKVLKRMHRGGVEGVKFPGFLVKGFGLCGSNQGSLDLRRPPRH